MVHCIGEILVFLQKNAFSIFQWKIRQRLNWLKVMFRLRQPRIQLSLEKSNMNMELHQEAPLYMHFSEHYIKKHFSTMKIWLLPSVKLCPCSVWTLQDCTLHFAQHCCLKLWRNITERSERTLKLHFSWIWLQAGLWLDSSTIRGSGNEENGNKLAYVCVLLDLWFLLKDWVIAMARIVFG